jgi:putative membrane-bound dehydrogenase-like protein
LLPPPAPPTNQFELNGQTFTLPTGFEIELVAGPPLVDRPIAADFDDQGRLFVTESSGSSEKVQEQLKKKPHRVLMLEDTDGDGKFDKRTVFADKMMFPEGIMYLDGSVYVAAPPSIWKLTDTDGDGVADERTEWFQGKTLNGCANDLHGPYAGPDGWVYWCKGAFEKQTYERPGKKPLVTRAAHIFRARPDGSGVEPVMTGGMDNPVDVVFTPGGERIFTTTFLVNPGGGQRDGLIHAVYGGIYGKDFHVIYDHPWSGPTLMPVLTHLGPAAPCGLTRYESSVFGPGYQDNLFACLFNLQKVTRHVLEPDGATFKSHDSDFLVSSRKDFHPTDVIEDADGSLLVIDTGGWYKLCCPTSQLVKPDVLGGIYRIRKKGAQRPDDPRGLKLNWPKLTVQQLGDLLGDPRPAVRKRAVAALGKGGLSALPVLEKILKSSPSVEPRRNAVWAAARNAQPGAVSVLIKALDDADESVRQAACHAISVRRDPGATHALLKLLKSPSWHNRRAAAEALGRVGDGSVVPALLEALGEPADRVLEHSLTYALIEIGDPIATAAGVKSKNPLIKRAALTALDQMADGNVPVEVVVKELNAANPKLRESAWWIANHHPEWGKDLAGFLHAHLKAGNLGAAEQKDLAQTLAKLAKSKTIQDLLAEQLLDAQAPPQARQLVLQAMAKANLKEAPLAWIKALADVLPQAHGDLLAEAVRTARALRYPKQGTGALAAALAEIGGNEKLPSAVRLGALAALPGGLAKVEPDLFTFLCAQVKAEQPVASRMLAAEVLSHAKLSTAQLVTLAATLKAAGPMEADRLLDAFGQSSEEQVGLALLSAVQASAVKSAFRVDKLKATLAKYGPAVQKQAAPLYAALKVDTAAQQARLAELLPLVKKGDSHKGHLVFNSQKAACMSCHTIGYVGGKIGPDLTRVGATRSELDLLEAIVFPSASFVRSYEPVSISTTQGKVYNGIISKETADQIVLTLGADQQVTIPREEIDVMLPSSVSIMPAGLDKVLTPQELADLVAFLKACK